MSASTDIKVAIMREMPGATFREKPDGITSIVLGPVVDRRASAASILIAHGYSSFLEAVRATRTVDDKLVGDSLKSIIDAGYPLARFERYFDLAAEQLAAAKAEVTS